MRARVAGLLLPLAAALVLVPTRGQGPQPAPPAPPAAAPEGPAVRPASFAVPLAPGPARAAAVPAFAGLDYARLPPLQQQFALSAARAADWLSRMNGVKGRFLHGWRPDLAAEMD